MGNNSFDDDHHRGLNGQNDQTDNSDGLGVDAIEVDTKSGAGQANKAAKLTQEDKLKQFLELHASSKPDLEIIEIMGITLAQFDRFLGKMHRSGQITPRVKSPYEAVRFSSLPQTLKACYEECFTAEERTQLVKIETVSVEDMAKMCGNIHKRVIILTPLIFPGSTSQKD